MRPFPLVLAVLLAAAGAAAAENSAQIRLYCLSIRAHPGVLGGGLGDTLAFYSGNNPGAPNGELWPLLDDPDFTHTSGLVYRDPALGFSADGAIALNAPEDQDDNGDGVPDFYQVGQATAQIITDGVFDLQVDFGPAAATWSREAGSPTGRLELQLIGGEFGALPPFRHTYEIIEYAGTLVYPPGAGTITGRVDLARAGRPAETLRGPVVLRVTATNEFHVDESSLTNHLGQAVRVSVGVADMDPDYAFSYFGALSLLDGDPATPEVDYELFLLGVDDPNDWNGNGIPDLTDPRPAGGAPPVLALALAGPDGVRLTLTGEAGRTYGVEARAALGTGTWGALTNLTLTNATQSLDLPRSPAGGFFRAVLR